MSAKYLRKIILEELRKVLKEDAPTAVGVAPKFSTMQIAVMNLQKQLRKLGATQGYKGKTVALRIDGALGPLTRDALFDSRIRGKDYMFSALKSISGIRQLTKDLSRLTPEQYEENRRITNREAAAMFAKSEQEKDQVSVAPKSPLEGPGGKVEKKVEPNIGPSSEEIEKERIDAEEKREAERQVYPLVPKQESLIRKEINKLLKQL